jgi:hypothetical protein
MSVDVERLLRRRSHFSSESGPLPMGVHTADDEVLPCTAARHCAACSDARRLLSRETVSFARSAAESACCSRLCCSAVLLS